MKNYRKGESLSELVDELDNPTTWNRDHRDIIVELFRELIQDVYGFSRYHPYRKKDFKT
jgi:hypothetical protein